MKESYSLSLYKTNQKNIVIKNSPPKQMWRKIASFSVYLFFFLGKVVVTINKNVIK